MTQGLQASIDAIVARLPVEDQDSAREALATVASNGARNPAQIDDLLSTLSDASRECMSEAHSSCSGEPIPEAYFSCVAAVFAGCMSAHDTP